MNGVEFVAFVADGAATLRWEIDGDDRVHDVVEFSVR
jgi:hypothetical protein